MENIYNIRRQYELAEHIAFSEKYFAKFYSSNFCLLCYLELYLQCVLHSTTTYVHTH
jgi:hypothetical protein